MPHTGTNKLPSPSQFGGWCNSLALCRTFGIHTAARNWFSYKPLPVVENAKIKILWHFGVITVSHIESNRPDIIVFLIEAPEKILLIEVSC